MDWLLYDRDLCHERVKGQCLQYIERDKLINLNIKQTEGTLKQLKINSDVCFPMVD